MPDSGSILSETNPSWMEDGLGITGAQNDAPDDNEQEWDTNAWSDQNQAPEDFVGGGGGCAPSDPPDSGTYVWGTIGGECGWIDTTDCDS